jgi:hypothetical protein
MSSAKSSFAVPILRTLVVLAVAGTLALVPAIASQADPQLTIAEQPAPTTEVASNDSAPYTLYAQSSDGFADVDWQQADAPTGPWTDGVGSSTVLLLSTSLPAGTVKYYQAVFTSGGSSVTSDVAKVTWIQGAPFVSWPAVPIVQLAGDTVHKTMTVTGLAPITVKWQLAASPFGPWTDIPNATTTDLTLTIDDSMNGEYLRPVASNSFSVLTPGIIAPIMVLPTTPTAPTESAVDTIPGNTVASVTLDGTTAIATFTSASASVITPGSLIYGYAYSSPTPLGWTRVLPDGTAQWNVGSLPVGVHTLAVMIPFGLVGAVLSGSGTFTVPPATTPPATPTAATTPELASTGASDAGPLALAATCIMLLGVAMVLRRRFHRPRA